ncbi:MAG: DNA-binding response regulator [Flavobacteriaceae bacterium]|nr:MAG: DNA-binding response regulator [Flavobacteriaceae bacterium]
MITAIALDDELPSLEIIQLFCQRLDFVDLQKTFLKTSLANEYLEQNPVDLIFLDINMPSRNGMDFKRALSQDTMVIFTTAYKEYALESYEVGAVDYLLKPFGFERFKVAVEKAMEHKKMHSTSETGFLYFKVDHGLVKVFFEEILYIEGLDNYIKIHHTKGKPLVVRMTMVGILEKLPSSQFCRVHRSFIVSLNKITLIKNKTLFLGETQISLGQAFEKDFKEKMPF